MTSPVADVCTHVKALVAEVERLRAIIANPQPWTCEEHPGKVWPHGDCSGPGMPWTCCEKIITDLKLLLIRKSEALAVFADPNMWQPSRVGAGMYWLWLGENEPVAFAKREAEATEATGVKR